MNLSATIETIPESTTGKRTIYNQMQPIAASYLSEVTYDPSDYSISEIGTYISVSTTYRKDRPSGATVTIPSSGALTVYDGTGVMVYDVTAGSFVIENITPGSTGIYVLRNSSDEIIQTGVLKPSGTLRMINGGGGTFNIRDLGGWACDGGKLDYGKIFRGCELNGDNYHITLTDEQKRLFTDFLGIRDEIDLRGNSEVDGDDDIYGTDDDITESALGKAVDYVRYPIAAYANGVNLSNAAQTAYYAALIKRICADVAAGKPCYIHCMAGADRTGTACALIEAICGVAQSDIDKDYELTSFSTEQRTRTSSAWVGFISAIESMVGTTFRDKAVAYAIRAGVTIEEINVLRNALIDGTPETLVSPFSNVTVTNALTDVTTDNTASQAEMYGAYAANLSPFAGYRIDSVSVTMDGVDITASAYRNGAISIQSVTGAIVITANAVQINYAVDAGYTDGNRWSGSDGTARSASGFTAINEIAIPSNGYPVTFKLSGVNWRYNSSCVIVLYKNGTYNTSKTLNSEWTSSSVGGSLSFDSNDSNAVVITFDSDMGFDGFKVCGYGSGANAVIRIVS